MASSNGNQKIDDPLYESYAVDANGDYPIYASYAVDANGDSLFICCSRGLCDTIAVFNAVFNK